VGWLLAAAASKALGCALVLPLHPFFTWVTAQPP
jgi:hypothetical protein